MANGVTHDIHPAAVWSIALSVLMIVCGLFAIALPMIAGVAVTAIAGWLLIFSGVLHFAMAWRGGRAAAVIWEILLGVVYAAIGAYVLARPLIGLESLTIVVAIYLFLEGALEVLLSFRLRPAAGAGWLLLDGIITLALALFISFTWPASAFWVIGTIVGISMLLSGVTRLMFSNSLRRLTASPAAH